MVPSRGWIYAGPSLAVLIVVLQASPSSADLATLLGTGGASWPRNTGPSWPTSDPKAIANNLLSMCKGPPVTDHPFAYWVVAPWGATGRDDQAPLQAMEIGGLRLYRCHIGWPERDTLDLGWPIKDFLNHVWLLGLRVAVSLDGPLYAQSSSVCQPERSCGPAGICFLQRYGCYDNVRLAWRSMLTGTGLAEDGAYHPALAMIILMVEPDTVVSQYCAEQGVTCSWPEMLRSVLSSWDAILDAEYERGVQGSVNFTTSFLPARDVSSRKLPKCYYLRHPNGCAESHNLRNMWLAANDYLEDEYEPHNDLGASFNARWVHSLNPRTPPADLPVLMQEYYSFIAPVHGTPANVVEFHSM
mmetsp:Transcript_168552/g.323947  ORF Transcript_168552/g.323947 Transcript_168552/m.323947 type:complete len:357 (-) Transcript_168552:71-1141(-)